LLACPARDLELEKKVAKPKNMVAEFKMAP
jgi:hypothetical protein